MLRHSRAQTHFEVQTFSGRTHVFLPVIPVAAPAAVNPEIRTSIEDKFAASATGRVSRKARHRIDFAERLPFVQAVVEVETIFRS